MGFAFLNQTTVKYFWISGGGFNQINIIGNYGSLTYSNSTLSLTHSSASALMIIAFR